MVGEARARGLLLLGASTALGGLALLAASLQVADPLAPQDAEDWTYRTVALAEGQGYLRDGEPWVGHVPVRSLALRAMLATLSWEDDAPGSGPDEFTLELVPPAGLFAGAPAEGDEGLLQVVVPVYARPPAREPELGVGSWAVRVYLRNAGDATTLGMLPGQPDRGNDFRIAVSASVFEARS